MDNSVKLIEKYERNGWPSVPRPDLKPPEGWSISLLTSLERIRSHALSPDGSAISYIKDSASLSDVYLLPLNGQWPTRITTDRDLWPYWDDEIPDWSPDGKWLAFCVKGHVHVVSCETGRLKKITDFTSAASSPRWMPDSNGIIITVERYEYDQLILTDRDGSWPHMLTNDTIGDHWDARPSPDGKFITYILRRYDDLNRLDVILLEIGTGKQTTLYGKPSTRAGNVRWSPDGKWIAFTSQETGREELYLIKPSGEGLRQLTKANEDIMQFAWAPDSKRIAACVNRGGAWDLCIIETESGSRSELRSGRGIHSNPYWSADGSFITFEYESPVNHPDVYKIDVQTKQVTQLTYSTPLALARNKLAMSEQVSYKSFDGLEIPAFIYRPEKSNGAAIVYPHGGPTDQYGYHWDDLAQYFVAKGYTWLSPNYRGSTGYGRDFERAIYNDSGGGDAQDCLYAAKFLRTVKGIEHDRIGIAGGSYGGILTINCLSRDPEYLYACGVSKYGDSNPLSSWAECEKRLRVYTEIYMGHPAKNPEVYRKCSPILDVANMKKPVLVLHGLLDRIVPPESSEEWVEQLKKHDKVFEYKTYANEPHGFLRRENLQDAYERMERFLDWYLLPFIIEK
jgi:dipeptidyl aminopeptidase/acylaminoacyl peptidase